jgi:hypothetical protein
MILSTGAFGSFTAQIFQVFRFASSKNSSLFLQRKNPRKIAWTQVFRRMHKKGITEEVAKKRSRRTVKHQRGIVGADLAAIAAKRNQTAAVRQQQRLVAITKAKSEKKDKEVKKAKVSLIVVIISRSCIKTISTAGHARKHPSWPQGIETADEGWQGWTMSCLVEDRVCMAYAHHEQNSCDTMHISRRYDMAFFSNYRARICSVVVIHVSEWLESVI